MRITTRNRTVRLLTLLFGVMTFAPGAAVTESFVAESCVHSHGYWKNHAAEWPVASQVLGDPAFAGHTYLQHELLSLLNGPAQGDASVILAMQLIAAKLNVANGASAEPIAGWLTRADALLAGFRQQLPYRVKSNTPVGSDMVIVASVLEQFNVGTIAGSCGPANTAPVANAGPAQSVPVGVTVTLDGSASSDADGQALAFRWAFVSTPSTSTAVLSDAGAVRPTFVPDVAGSYDVQLIVSDGTLDSAPSVVRISTINSAPTANAGLDQTAPVGASISLSGAASTDPDGDSLAFAWSMAERPDGSSADLVNPQAVAPSFTIDLPGQYRIELIVFDGALSSAPDSVTISTINSPPVARAGADTAATVGSDIILDGSASTDVDGDALTYRWTLTSRPASSATTLTNSTAVNPSFVPDLAGDYVVELIVNDGTDDSAPDVVIVNTSRGNTAPVAHAGLDQSAITGDIVQLDGSGSTDVDGDPLTFAWSFTSVPAGSAAGLSDPAAVQPTFTPDLSGTYVAQLIVSDPSTASAPSTVTITVAPRPPDNQAPIAEAGVAQTVPLNTVAQLDGSGSSDPDGDALTYAWSLLSRPAGSAAILSDPTAVGPSFTLDTHGAYVAQLIVNDGSVNSAADTVTISTQNSAPVADAGDDASVALGATVQLDGSGSFDADGSALTYAWSLTRPPGSNAVLSSTSTVNPTFVADVNGTFVAQLIVGDGVLASAPDTAAIGAGPGADIRLTFFRAPSNPPVGEISNWGISTHNLGSASPVDVQVSLPVPAGYTFVSASATQGSYDPATGIWTIPALSQSAGVHLFFDLRPNANGPYTLTVEVISSSAPDPDLSNNRLTTTPIPNANVNLGLSYFNFTPGTRSVGEEIFIIMDVNNAGPAAAADAAVDIRIPAGFSIINFDVSVGSYDPVTGLWTLGNFTSGGFARSGIRLRLNATGSIVLRAVATSTSPDSNPENNVLEVARMNRAPVANAGADHAGSTHALVTLDGTGSFDADGDPITFEWSAALRPINSDGSIAGSTTATPSVTPNLPGAYTYRLVVRDSLGVASVADSVVVTAVTTNRGPVFATTPARAAAIEQPYTYDADAIDPDAGDVLTFSLATSPGGMTINGSTGVISWTPTSEQAGQQNVVVRVQDAGGLFATQAVSLQVASPGNGAPLAVDDSYSVRVSESLSVNAPGVAANDTDESALTTRLVRPPGNGTATLNADGSFTYTPHSLQLGEFVMAENVNLASRMPGVTANGGGCPQCVIDENLLTQWFSADSRVEIVFPSDVTVSEVRLVGSTHPNDHKVTAGIFELESGAGAILYNSGPVQILGPPFDATLTLPRLAGVRRVRFRSTASTTGNVFSSSINELKVIGDGLIRRERFNEPNLVQLLATKVTSNSVIGGNTAEGLIDDAPSNWYSGGSPGSFIEVTFPIDVTPTQLVTSNPNGRPDGFNSSNGMDCSGTFTLLDANRTVLFDSGVVNEPSGFPSASDTFTLNFPQLSGIRHIRYTAATPCIGIFPHGFAEWRVFGAADVTTPSFSMAKKFQSLMGREAHSTPIVVNLTDDNGDGTIDADDTPDILVPVESVGDQLSGDIKAISGTDGTELFTAGTGVVSPWSELAAGDIDLDGLPEIIAVHRGGTNLAAFEHTGALKWISDGNAMPSFVLGSSSLFGGAVSIANLDGVGAPEIIVGASVFDSNGRLLGDGRTLGGTTGGLGLRSAISSVADIDLDGSPELVAGPTAYRLSNGQLSLVWRRADRADGYVAIANLDDDPQAELVIVANGSVYALNHDGSDYQEWNAPAHTPIAIPGGGQGGAPLAVDVDGNGSVEIGVAGSGSFVLFNGDGSVRWSAAISDRTSNSTGAVAFDLNGDGEVEIIYRDEFFLRVYRGADGVLLAKTRVGSATWAEEPVVADVDNDGHADIIVASDFFQQSAGDTGIIVFQDVANKWKRTRRIWNQHAYHVTNVNEDATIPVSESAHWLVPGLNNFRTNAFVPGESTDETDSFTYVASDGVLESNTATVRIAIRTPNSGPQITSTPVTAAADGVFYAYAAQASDPDAGDILTFSLPTAPVGMSIDPSSGLIAWTPTAAQQGAHGVVVKVADVRGLFALQSYQITVASAVTVPDVVGQIQAAAENAITSASLTIGAVTARHTAGTPEGSVVSQNPAGGSSAAADTPVSFVVSLGPPPVGTVPNVLGLAQTAAQQDVTAAGFTSTSTGQNNSVVPVGVVISQTPAGGTIAPSTTVVGLVVSLGPPPGELDLDGDGFTGDRGDCNDTNPAINPAAFDIPGDGIDQNCNGVDSIDGDGAAPIAALVSPADLAEVTTPIDIVGTVSDANFLRYIVEMAEVDKSTFTVIGSGTTPVTAGTVARLDPTLLENGLYRVRLIAEDVNGQTAVDERVYRVTGEAKVGVFALSFVDLQVPVSGIPITVVRSYDSRIKTSHEFGVGWRLEVKRGSYRHNRTPGFGWTIDDLPFLGEFLPCIGGTGEPLSHLTEVRLSDREVYYFKLAINTPNLGITGACEGTAAFEFVSGTFPGAALQILDGNQVIYLRGGPAEVLDMNAFLDGDVRVYNPRRVRLTTIDGRRVDFDPTGITQIEDDHSNRLTIGPEGVVHSSGKSIAFQRDSLGRITSITDPVGATLTYDYDASGDLVTFRDQVHTVTTFAYDDRHNLIEILDPLGRPALRSEFDADGRLVATIGARGQRTEFGHDVAARVETITDALGHVTTFAYDEQGNIVSHERPVTIGGATVLARSQFAYDSRGNQIRGIDPDAIRTDRAYDAGGNQLTLAVDPEGLNLVRTATYTASGDVLAETDPNGDTSQFVYDGDANPSRWIDVDGRTSALSYDAAGQVTRFVDPAGRATAVQYDKFGNATRRTDSRGNTMAFTYDANGNRLTATVFRTIGNTLRPLTTTYQYDARRRIIAVIDPRGAVTRTEYNAVGLMSSVVNALGRETRFTYDEAGGLVRTDYPDGTFETRVYDLLGRVISSTDREGLTSETQYDEAGRPIARVIPEGRTARTVYTPGGRIAAQIAADGSRTDYEYDGAGRMTVMRQPAVFDAVSGATVRPEWRFEYDAGSRRTGVIDPKGNRTQFSFDSLAGTITARRADGAQSVETRDQWGRILVRTDADGSQTTFAYVADTSQLAAVSLPAPAAGQAPPTWQFEYDETGNTLAQTDPLGRTTRFEYDEVNRLVRTVLPGGQVRSLEYDAIGRVTGLRDFDGGFTSFVYDAVDRLVTKTLPDGSIVNYTYTPGGRRNTVADARGLTRYEYDIAGRLTRRTQPGVGDLEYAYDLMDRVARVTTANGSVTYGYDALSRLTNVNGHAGGTDYAYDLAGNLTRLAMPNGVVGALAYDDSNQLTTLGYTRGGQPMASFAYTYTPGGRRATVAEPGATTSFTYDRIGRLTQESRVGTASFVRQYDYDAAGNRTRSIADGLTTLYSYDINDQLLSAGTVSFVYDDRGNPIRRNDAGLVTTYTWTPDNRLAQVTRGVDTVSYRYDADGTRVEKQTAAGTVRYLIDTLNPTRLAQVLEERDPAGSLIRRYDYGNGIIAQSDGAASRFYHPDGQGHIRTLTDAAGETVRSYDYDSFGNPVAESGDASNDYRYGGQQFDDDANLYYLRARYYDPGVGRFLGRDPINGDPFNPLSLNRYAYAGNDPCNLADPTGEEFTLLGLSVASVLQTGIRGVDVGVQLASRGSSICRVKGLAKVIPMAIGVRSWIAGKSQFAEKLIGMVSPSVSFGGLGAAVSQGSLAPLIPSLGLAYKEELFKHPLAESVPAPSRLMGEPKKLEIEVSASSLTEVSLKLTGELFPSTQSSISVGLQHYPSWALTSAGGGIGVDHPIFDIRVCGFISVGTINFFATGSVTATGLSSSAVSGSLELGLKMAVPFLPEAGFSILKVPDDFR